MGMPRGLSRFTTLASVLALLIGSMVAVGAPPASAATFNVTRFDDPVPNFCAPTDCSLREAILAANTDPLTLDTIALPAGVYSLTAIVPPEDANASGDLDITGDLNIIGAGQATTILDLAGLGERGFHILSGDVAISDMAIRNGTEHQGRDGGAILHAGTSLVVARTNFHNNALPASSSGSGGSGGAIYASKELTVEDSNFESNQAGSPGGHGGAIESSSRPLIVRDSIFISNEAGAGDDNRAAGSGGAIWNSGELTISDSAFVSNAAGDAAGSEPPGNGGAIQHLRGEVSVLDSRFESNRSGQNTPSATGPVSAGDGGAMSFGKLFQSSSDDVSIEGSTFTLNTTGNGGQPLGTSSVGAWAGVGGAIKLYITGTARISTTTFDRNSTGQGGGGSPGGKGGNGGAVWTRAPTNVERSTFLDNATGNGGAAIFDGQNHEGGAAGDGGAIYSTGGQLTVLGSTFGGNATGDGGTGTQGPDGSGGRGGNGGGITASLATASLSYTTIAFNSAGAGGAAGVGASTGSSGRGGGLWTNTSGSLDHTAIASNSAPSTGHDCYTVPVANLTPDHSFIGVDSACALLGGAGNQIGNLLFPIFPALGPIQFNGGPTLTMQPLPGSPLIDTGSATCTSADQRFVGRPQGTNCDIGAVEVGGIDLTIVSPGCLAYDSVASGDGPLMPGTPREVEVVGSGCVPAGASAVVLGLTAKSPQALGNLRISAAGVAPAGGVVNYVSNGLDNSNTITVPLSIAGAVDVAANAAATDIRLVVVGYYWPAGKLNYFPLTPCAVADSRTILGVSAPTGSFVGPFLATDLYPDVDVVGTFNAPLSDNQGGGNTDCLVPAGADAVMVNTVAIGPTGTGGLAIGEGGTTPTEATTNFAPIGLNNAAVALAPVDASGKISGDILGSPLSAGSTHIRLVVLGYFDTSGGQAYSPVNPCAAFDSRTGIPSDPNPPTGLFAGKRIAGASGVTTYQVTGAIPAAQGGETTCGVPGGATAVLVNLVAIQAEALGNFRAYATGSTPTGGVLNFAALTPAMNNSNAVVVPLSAIGEMDVFVNAPSNNGNPTVHARGVILGYFN